MSSARRMTLAEIIQQEHLWVIEDDIHSFNNLCTASSFTNVSRTLTSTNDLLSGDDKICLYRLTHCVPCFPPLLRQEIERAIFNINVKTSGFDAEIVTQVLRSPVAKELVIENWL